MVQRIIADGHVTHEERRELFIAIEAVLPTDVRSIAKTARRTQEERDRERLRIQREAERQRQLEESERNNPIEHWDFMVAGCRYEGRPEIISRYARVADTVFLIRDPNNKYSRNAIEVRTTSGHQIGFVPEEDAADMALLLDAGHPYLAEIKKILTGGRYPIPVVIAEVYQKAATLPNLIQPAAQPPQSVTRPPTVSSARAWIRLLVGLVVGGLVLITLIRACS